MSIRKKTSKAAKLRAEIRQELEGKKCSKNFFKVLEKQNLQNQTIFELYTDDNKSKYSILRTYLNLRKNCEKLYIKQFSTADTAEFLIRIPNRKKIPNEHFNFFRRNIFR